MMMILLLILHSFFYMPLFELYDLKTVLCIHICLWLYYVYEIKDIKFQVNIRTIRLLLWALYFVLDLIICVFVLSSYFFSYYDDDLIIDPPAFFYMPLFELYDLKIVLWLYYVYEIKDIKSQVNIRTIRLLLWALYFVLDLTICVFVLCLCFFSY